MDSCLFRPFGNRLYGNSIYSNNIPYRYRRSFPRAAQTDSPARSASPLAGDPCDGRIALEAHPEAHPPGVFRIVRTQAAHRHLSAYREAALAVDAAQPEQEPGLC